MELPSKLLEQLVFNTSNKIEGLRLIVMDKSRHEETISQALQTNNKHFKAVVTFLTDYNVIFMLQIKLWKSILQYRVFKMVSFKEQFHRVFTNLNH